MINEFDEVRIKGTSITGIVVDVHTSAGKTMCYVDSEQKGTPGEHGYDEDWDMFYLNISELEKI